jgi:hypothetical protein
VLVPDGYTVTVAPQLRVADETGQVLGHGGQDLWLGGGEIPLTQQTRDELGGCVIGDQVWLLGRDGIMQSKPL